MQGVNNIAERTDRVGFDIVGSQRHVLYMILWYKVTFNSTHRFTELKLHSGNITLFSLITKYESTALQWLCLHFFI